MPTKKHDPFYTAGKMTVEVAHEFDEEQGEVSLLVDALYRPGRAAPPCSDPDSPLFSDSGEGSEYEVLEVRLPTGGVMAKFGWLKDESFNAKVGEALDMAYDENRGDCFSDW
jgi:hypothetical protein